MTGRSLPHAILMMIPEPWPSHETHVAGAQGVLRVPLVADGAVGRPGVDRVHRRHGHRRGARSQRPAAVALLRDEGRPRHHGVGSRRARHPARGHPGQGAAAPGPHLPRRHRAGRIVSDEEIKRELAAAQPYGEWLESTSIDIEDLPPAPYLPPPSHETVRAAAAAVRLHAGRSAAAARADGDRRRRSDRLDGHRHGAARCCRTGRGCSTTTSSSCSRRSPTRRSTRSARSS